MEEECGCHDRNRVTRTSHRRTFRARSQDVRNEPSTIAVGESSCAAPPPACNHGILTPGQRFELLEVIPRRRLFRRRRGASISRAAPASLSREHR
jgi:hypothetical protein